MIRLILFGVFLFLSFTSFSQKKLSDIQVYTMIIREHKYGEDVISCEMQVAKFYLSKRKLIYISKNVDFDINIIQRSSKNHWLGVTNDGIYYSVSGLITNGFDGGLRFNQVDKDLNRLFDYPSVLISTTDICIID